jgi:hypothetical protein
VLSIVLGRIEAEISQKVAIGRSIQIGIVGIPLLLTSVGAFLALLAPPLRRLGARRAHSYLRAEYEKNANGPVGHFLLGKGSEELYVENARVAGAHAMEERTARAATWETTANGLEIVGLAYLVVGAIVSAIHWSLGIA